MRATPNICGRYLIQPRAALAPGACRSSPCEAAPAAEAFDRRSILPSQKVTALDTISILLLTTSYYIPVGMVAPNSVDFAARRMNIHSLKSLRTFRRKIRPPPPGQEAFRRIVLLCCHWQRQRGSVRERRGLRPSLGLSLLRQSLWMLWQRVRDVVPRGLHAGPEVSLWFHVWVIIQGASSDEDHSWSVFLAQVYATHKSARRIDAFRVMTGIRRGGRRPRQS